MDREKSGWTVQLHSEQGQVYDQEVWAYWDPDREGMEHTVRAAAVGMAGHELGGKTRLVAGNCERIETPATLAA